MGEAGTMPRSRVDPTVAIDLAEVGRVVSAICPEALGIWVYGSFAAGCARPESDVDIGFLPQGPLRRADLFDRAVEIGRRLRRDIDLVDLTDASDLLRFEALARGQRVAARDPLACDRFEVAAIGMYLDLREDLEGWLEDIRERGTVF